MKHLLTLIAAALFAACSTTNPVNTTTTTWPYSDSTKPRRVVFILDSCPHNVGLGFGQVSGAMAQINGTDCGHLNLGDTLTRFMDPGTYVVGMVADSAHGSKSQTLDFSYDNHTFKQTCF